jgi:hypothetical protein
MTRHTSRPSKRPRWTRQPKISPPPPGPMPSTNFKLCISRVPGNIKVSEFLAEAALNTGNIPLAISLMQPIRQSSPVRWQASALLARAYAESNRDAERDAEIANLQRLHDTKAYPRLAQTQQFLLEFHKTPTGSVRIWYSLEPWGKSRVYLFARIYDIDGQEKLHVTLDSSDFEQISWAKAHPKEAAAGQQIFFLDSYSSPQNFRMEQAPAPRVSWACTTDNHPTTPFAIASFRWSRDRSLRWLLQQLRQRSPDCGNQSRNAILAVGLHIAPAHPRVCQAPCGGGEIGRRTSLRC